MADAEQTKVCPLCAETIKAAAKVCPHCRKSQRGWVFLTRYDIGAILSLVLTFGIFYFLIIVFYHSRDFALDRDKIRVTDFQLALDRKSHETNVVMSGILTNESGYPWKIGNFEIRYLDNSGKILNEDRGSEDFTILPHSDHSFKLTLYQQKSVLEYAHCKVAITSAQDPRSPFLNLFGN